MVANMSEKRGNFVRLAESRVNRAIKDIRLIGNLSNKSNYSYEEADVNKIIRALTSELNDLKLTFGKKGGGSSSEFKL